MTMTRFDSAMGLHEAQDITLKQLETYKFDSELSVTVEVLDIEPTVIECDNSSSRSHNFIHLNKVVPDTSSANNQSYKSNYYQALDSISKSLSDIICKYYIMRCYTTSKKEWREIAPYYTNLKSYYFNAIASDVAEFILPREQDRDFIEKFLHKTLTLTRKMSDNPKLVAHYDLQYIFVEMITYTKRKMTIYNIEKSLQMNPPPLYAETAPVKAISPNEQPEPGPESPMPIITHITSLSPHKKAVDEGRCVLCAKVTGKICVGCYKTYYCSNVCQTIHWGKHKYECVYPI